MQRKDQAAQPASPSFTALTSALAFKNALATEYGSLFTADDIRFVDHMVSTAITHEPDFFKRGGERVLDYSPYGGQRFFLDRTFAPGYVEQKLGRKKMIEAKIKHDIEHAGLEQVVFLSGGYDPRGYITAKQYPGVQVFELDRGKTREIKLKAFQTLPDGFTSEYKDFHFTPTHTSINGNYHLLECDFLKDDLRERLISCGFDPKKKTLFIAEGLTMYLPESDNKKLLAAMTALLPDQSFEVLLSYRSQTANQSLGAALQATSQETYSFGMTPEQVAKFVTEQGYQLKAGMLYQDLLAWVHSETKDDPQPTAGREHYYLLEKASRPYIPCLADLPLVSDALPPVIKPKKGDCAFL